MKIKYKKENCLHFWRNEGYFNYFVVGKILLLVNELPSWEISVRQDISLKNNWDYNKTNVKCNE